MWFSTPSAQGQSSTQSWREAVNTRQPAALKCLTVAWPMPRLAPVNSRVLGWLMTDSGGGVMASAYTSKNYDASYSKYVLIPLPRDNDNKT